MLKMWPIGFTVLPVYVVLMAFFTCSGSFSAAAQNKRNDNYWLVFEKDSLYLGRLDREQAPIKATFKFVTGSRQAVKIKDVKPDCACASVAFPKETLQPNQEGEITVEFRPYRAGPFDKEFIIFFEGLEDEVSLKMTGYLEAFYPSPALEFPFKNGPLQLRFKKIHFGTINSGEVVKKEIEVYNDQNQTVSFSDSVLSPSHIQVILPEDRKVRAKGTAKILVYYNTSQREGYGYLADQIRLFLKEGETRFIDLEAMALLLPKKAVANQNGELPRLKLSADSIDIGTVYEYGQIVSIQLMNLGRAPLSLHKIEAQPGCEILSLQSTTIAPLGSVNLNVRILDNGFSGSQQRTLSIFSNDPDTPYYPVHVFLQQKSRKR